LIFGDFGLQDTFQEQIAPKSIKINKKKLHIKFAALNVDFEGIKERYTSKVIILSLLASLSWKQL